MKQFKTIFGHELAYQIKNKAFIIVTAILVIAIAVVMFFPRFTENKSAEQSAQTEQTEEKQSNKIALVVGGDVDADIAKQAFAEEYQDEKLEVVIESDIAQVKEKILSGEYDFAYDIPNMTTYTYITKTISVYDGKQPTSDHAMEKLNYLTALKTAGAGDDVIKQVSDLQIVGTPEALEADQTKNYFYTYIMVFALYMIIILYGTMVATNVASEKSSRAMEVLITSARPTALMFGKILAACVAGMSQLILVFGTAVASYKINEEYWTDNPFVGSIFNIPTQMIFYMLLFFLLGFLLYAMMFGAIGSMATKVEDINSLQTPITLVFVIAFFIVITGMNGDVNSPLMVVASYVPFTSPMAMFTRIVMGDIAWFEIVISVVILIASTIGIGILSARIYRAGVLHYGKPPKFGEMLKSAKEV